MSVYVGMLLGAFVIPGLICVAVVVVAVYTDLIELLIEQWSKR